MKLSKTISSCIVFEKHRTGKFIICQMLRFTRLSLLYCSAVTKPGKINIALSHKVS